MRCASRVAKSGTSASSTNDPTSRSKPPFVSHTDVCNPASDARLTPLAHTGAADTSDISAIMNTASQIHGTLMPRLVWIHALPKKAKRPHSDASKTL